MRKVIILLLCAATLTCCTSPEGYVKKAVRLMDKYGLFATGPQWEKAKTEALTWHPETIEQAQNIISQALEVAGGKHSFLKTSEVVAKHATATDWEMPSVTETDNGNILVITIPQFGGNSEQSLKYAESVLEDSLIKDKGFKGVVIDLRNNTGGNMYPMITAVHQFLPSGKLIGFKTRKQTVWYDNFTIRNVVIGGKEYEHIEVPVAILTNEMTGSSGECVLICFRGLKNVRTFGKPTAGYASANTPYSLPDGSQLVLTTGCDVARTGEVFCDDPIAPDVDTETPMEDAIAWLNL